MAFRFAFVALPLTFLIAGCGQSRTESWKSQYEKESKEERNRTSNYRSMFGFDRQHARCLAFLIPEAVGGKYESNRGLTILSNVPSAPFPRQEKWRGDAISLFVPILGAHYGYLQPSSVTATEGAFRETPEEVGYETGAAWRWPTSSGTYYLRFPVNVTKFPVETDSWLTEQLPAQWAPDQRDGSLQVWKVQSLWFKKGAPPSFEARWKTSDEYFPCVATARK